MKIAVPAEAGERRVAATPETVKKFAARGATVAVEAGAGAASLLPDAAYAAAGATVAPDAAATVQDADIVLRVRRPTESELKAYKPGALVVATMDPYGHEDAVKAVAAANVAAFAMEFMPRMSRAQRSQGLSS